jgi:uncharacterized glyoxalase superfamily protein PhnB
MRFAAAGRPIVTKAIFPIVDMGEALDFYSTLGFSVESFDAGYAVVLHEHVEILHLRLVGGLDPAANPAAAYLHVADADAWHDRWAEDVAVAEVADTPWGMREFSLTDPSGNLIRVGHNL